MGLTVTGREILDWIHSAGRMTRQERFHECCSIKPASNLTILLSTPGEKVRRPFSCDFFSCSSYSSTFGSSTHRTRRRYFSPWLHDILAQHTPFRTVCFMAYPKTNYLRQMRLREIKHGRLAMGAFAFHYAGVLLDKKGVVVSARKGRSRARVRT